MLKGSCLSNMKKTTKTDIINRACGMDLKRILERLR
jgi:hypothetical protein